MTKDTSATGRFFAVGQPNLLFLLVFFTGILIGCLIARISGMQYSVSFVESAGNLLHSSFPATVLANAKFLLLIYLLAFLRNGSGLIPILFGIEGVFYGAAITAGLNGMGTSSLILLTSVLFFRLFIVLPYGFLLGRWAIGQSLSFGVHRGNRMQVFCVTLVVIAAASFLEVTLGQWLGRIFYLKFGV